MRLFARLPATVTVAGRTLPLLATRHARARGVRMRADPISGAVKLTLPAHGGVREALRLLESHQGWLAAQVAKWPQALPFVPGARLPFDGGELTLDWDATRPLRVARSDDRLLIGGPLAGVGDRTRRWLIAQARAALLPETHAHAARIGHSVTSITLNDPKGRWGSCNALQRRINYSWRLILAPAWVRTAVVAHEVAHLAHPHHGPAFWREVAGLNPDAERSKAWLARHGRALHLVGR